MNIGFIAVLITTSCIQTFLLAEMLQKNRQDVSYSGFNTFKVEIQDGVAMVTFDFPPVNLQGKPMLNDLNSLAEKLEEDGNIKVVVFQSAHPDIFISHSDFDQVSEINEFPENTKLTYPQAVFQRLSSLPQATIAKVEGMARGGGLDFILACDMSFAARGKAVFMQMEVGMGIVPYGGATQRLPRAVGLGRSLELILGAHDFDADLAEKYGVINRALNPDEIYPFVDLLAHRISKFPSTSIAACKRSVYASSELGLAKGLEKEATQFRSVMSQGQEKMKILNQRRGQYWYMDLGTQKNWDKGVMDIQGQ